MHCTCSRTVNFYTLYGTKRDYMCTTRVYWRCPKSTQLSHGLLSWVSIRRPRQQVSKGGWVLSHWVLHMIDILCLLWHSRYTHILVYSCNSVFLHRIVLQQSIMCTISTSLSPGQDLPSLHLLCVRIQSPHVVSPCLSWHRHLIPSYPLSPRCSRSNHS